MLSRARSNDENATAKARRPKPPTADEVICAFLEHLECAVHTILFQRDIYPKGMFMTARKYDRPVRMCRVPKVNEYVRNMIDMVGAQLREGGVQVISIVILSKDDVPLERFVFSVSHIAKSKNGARKEIYEDLRMEDLHEQFVDVISSLEACSYSLDDLPPDCTFTVMMEMASNHENPRDASVTNPVVSLEMLTFAELDCL
ncbi:DNA-binding protein [Pyronema omphalodes]|nr:DNA-binding protein [Pyronema omphalodes]